MDTMPVETVSVMVESAQAPPPITILLYVVRDVIGCRVDMVRVRVAASVMLDPPSCPKNPFDIVKNPH